MSGAESLRGKRVLRAFICALAITAVSCWPMFVPSIDIPEMLVYILSIFMMPGIIVAIIIARNPHTGSLSVVVLANLAIYTALVYALLGIRGAHKSE